MTRLVTRHPHGKTPAPLACLLLLLSLSAASLTAEHDLQARFQTPPPGARPWVYWFWMNGNITEEGITADLEAMARVGIGGTLIMSVSTGIPPGKVDFMTPQWRELFAFAVREADRLGLEIIMNNDDGWTGSGGPWNSVENSMQVLTWSEVRVNGPMKFADLLPRPPATRDHYRDISLFAFPTPSDAAIDFRESRPKLTASDAQCEVARLVDGDVANVAGLPRPAPDKLSWIQIEFSKPYRARSLTLHTGAGRHGHRGEIQVSDDGKAFHTITKFRIPSGSSPIPVTLGFDAVESPFFRIVFTRADSRASRIRVAELDLHGDARIANWPAKAGFYRSDRMEPDDGPTAAASLPREEILDLTSTLAADGRLEWDVPQGHWTLLRLGHTTNGKMNHPCTPKGIGLECDKLSKEALRAHFDGFLAKLAADAGPRAGKTLIATHIDSWEVGAQNWTPKLREEFKARRGYDPFPYLPALTGRAVQSAEISERFLWDFRKTIADLMADNYFGHLRALAEKHGMGLSAEAYGSGNFDNLQCAGRTDIPMNEFWAGSSPNIDLAKQASSAAHANGRRIVAAESFTATDTNGKWQNHPYALKALGDRMYCAGVNRFVFHRYAMQPWQDRWPGITFGKWGIHYERTLTWFDESRAWLRYLARCQHLLQEGDFVADLCFFLGESAPNGGLDPDGLRPRPPAGYDYDGCNDEVIFNLMSVDDGRIVLPSGASYRVLVLPESRFMSPALLRKLRDLVRDGAHVVGPKPEKSPSLAGYPQCDEDVRAMAGELWGDTSSPGERASGKGKIYWGKPLEQVLETLAVPPDVESPGGPSENRTWIHRRIGNAEVYFISNQNDSPEMIDATYRVGGKIPELWHPDTGLIEPAGVWQPTADGRTTVRFRLEPRGSVFVVFRKPVGQIDPVVAVSRNGKLLVGEVPPAKIVVRSAIYGVLDDPDRTLDVTAKVASEVAEGRRSVRVWSTLGGDPAFGTVKTLRVEFTIDGQERTASARDGQMLSFPRTVEPARPDVEIQSRDEKPRLLAYQGGRYEFKTASGKNHLRKVPQAPAPIPLSGPWELRFPPGWGAPESVVLDKLISWPEHPDDGVKHFSGTAAYHKTLHIPADRLGQGEALFLDLGRVAVIAEVKLNGHDLGILWKPPFRVEITGAAKAGANQLEVRVTNLWINRLIGDERKPAYLEWTASGGPAEWPDWLADGGPVPETGRYTFTTWHHYDEDSPLLESGLLGPVTLPAAAILALPGSD